MEKKQRNFFKDVREFDGSDFDDATKVIFAERVALCKAIAFIKDFAATMRGRYSIIKDGVDMLDYQITEYDFSDPASIELIVKICNYEGPVDLILTKDRFDFANYLINLGYDLKKKKKG